MHGLLHLNLRPKAGRNDFCSNSNSNFEFESKRGVGRNDFCSNFRLKLLRWAGGAACSMSRVSGIDEAYGISAHHMFLSNCVMQVMRVWSLPAVLSPLAKLHRRYGVTQPTAYRISHLICGGPGMKTPCAYIWMPFQLRRSLVAFGLDLPVMSVHGAGAYHAETSPACNRTQHTIFHGCDRLGSAACQL